MPAEVNINSSKIRRTMGRPNRHFGEAQNVIPAHPDRHSGEGGNPSSEASDIGQTKRRLEPDDSLLRATISQDGEPRESEDCLGLAFRRNSSDSAAARGQRTNKSLSTGGAETLQQ